MPIAGEEDSWLLVADGVDEELSKDPIGDRDSLLGHARSSMFSRRYLEIDLSPRRRWHDRGLREELLAEAAQSDEVDAHVVQPGQIRLGCQSRVEYELSRQLAVCPLPEGDEAEDPSDSSPWRRSAFE